MLKFQTSFRCPGTIIIFVVGTFVLGFGSVILIDKVIPLGLV